MKFLILLNTDYPALYANNMRLFEATDVGTLYSARSSQ